MTACLGGWCSSRERCAAYHASDRRHPVERLCPAGQEYPQHRSPQSMTLPQLIAAAQRIGEHV